MKKKTTPKTTRNKTKQPPTAKCDSTDIGVTEFQVYYSSIKDGEWEHDDSFATLAEAEAYCHKKAEIYAEDVQSGEDQPIPWEFYIYEVKAVRSFFYRYKVEVTVEES
jgi:hypothetical protein